MDSKAPISDRVDTVQTVLDLFEHSVSVEDLVRGQRLYAVRPDMHASAACEELERRGFDHAPVLGAPVTTFVVRDDLAVNNATVRDVARPISHDLRLAESASLMSAFEALADHPCLFAVHRQHVTGIVTYADLQQPSVSLLALGLVTATEHALDVVIEAEHGGGWLDCLSEERGAKVREVFAQRQRYNAEIAPIRALNLDDRMTIICCSSEATRQALGFSSKTDLRRWTRSLSNARNCLAHGDGLLGAIPEPSEALKLLRDIHHFARTAASVADDVYESPDPEIASLRQ